MAACNADLSGQAGTLGAHGVLDDLHHDGAPFKHLLFNRHQGLARPGRCSLAFSMLLPHVGDMQKSSLVQPDVDESRLHARQNPRDFAKVNVAHQAALECSFDVQLLHRTKFDHCDPGFLGRPIDQNILLHGWNQVGEFEIDSTRSSTPPRHTAQQRMPKDRNKQAVSKSGKPMMPE